MRSKEMQCRGGELREEIRGYGEGKGGRGGDGLRVTGF